MQNRPPRRGTLTLGGIKKPEEVTPVPPPPAPEATPRPARASKQTRAVAEERIWHSGFEAFWSEVDRIINNYVQLGANKSKDPIGTIKSASDYVYGVFAQACAGSRIHQIAFDRMFPKHRVEEPIENNSVTRGWREIAADEGKKNKTMAYARAWIADQVLLPSQPVAPRSLVRPEHRHLSAPSAFRSLTVHL